jgi:hypothetical protein
MKVFETKKSLKLAQTILRNQIKALKISGKGDIVIRTTLAPILEEKVNLLQYIGSVKNWNFNFEGGGWNSNYAKTKEESYKMALKEYKGSKNCVPSESTFRVATEADTRNLLSLFY